MDFLPANRRPPISSQQALFLAALVVAVQVGLTFGLRRQESVLALTTDLLSMLASYLAAGGLFLAARFDKRQRRAWLLLALAQLSAALGDTVWTVFEVVLQQSPFPSIADVLYLAYYPLFAAGILSFPFVRFSLRERVRLLLDMGIAMLAASVAFWTLLLEPIVRAGAVDRLTLALSLAYPVADLGLLFGLLWLLFGLRLQKFGRQGQWPLALLAAGLSVQILTDAVFGYQSLQATYVSGDLLDAGWLIAYGFVGLAGVQQAGATSPAEPERPLVTADLLPAESWGWTLYVPYVVLALAIAVTLWGRGHSLDLDPQDEYNAIVAIIGLVLARQLIALNENEQLLRSEKMRRQSDAVLLDLSRRLLTAQNEQAALATAVEVAATALRADYSYCAMVDSSPPGGAAVSAEAGHLIIRAAHGWTAEAVELGWGRQSHAGLTILRGHPVVVNDYASEKTFTPLPVLQTNCVAAGVSAPLLLEGRPLGALVALSRQPRHFTDDEQRLVTLIANQSAVALEHAQLIEESRRQAQELAGLYDTALATSSVLDTDALLQRLYEQVRRLLNPDTFVVALYRPEVQAVDVALAMEQDRALLPFRVPLSEAGLTGWVITHQQSLLVGDLAADPVPVPPSHRTRPARSWLGVPLLARDRVIGAVSVQSFKPHAFSAGHSRFLDSLARQVAVALDNARLYEALADEKRRLELLYDITRAGIEISDFNNLRRTLADRLSELLAGDACYLILGDEAQERVIPPGPDDAKRDHVLEGGLPPGDVALTQAVMRERRPLAVEDLSHSSYLSPNLAAPSPYSSALGLPLVVSDQRLGAAIVAFKEPHHFTLAEISRGEQAAGQIALALAKTQLFDQLRRSAEEMRATSEIMRALNATPDVTQAFPAIVQGIKAISDCERISLALLDPDRASFTIVALDQPRAELYQGITLPLAATAAAADVLAGRTHLTPDLAAENEFMAEKALYEAGHRSRLNLPLRAGEHILGALNIVWTRVEGYHDADLVLFRQIADAVALAVEKSRLFSETRRRADELGMLVEVSAALRVAQTTEAMLSILLRQTAQVVGTALFSVFLVNTETGELMLRACHPPEPGMIGLRHRPGEGIAGHVAATGEIYIGDDLAHDPFAHLLPGERERWSDVPTSVTLPLRAQERVVGVIQIGLREPKAVIEREVRLLTALAEIAGQALHRASVMETLEQRVAERTRELAEANERLKELDRLKDRFVSNVSHELRTPLTNIKLHLGLLEKRGPDVLDRHMPTLQRETERLRRLIEDLLDLSRPPTQLQPLMREPHELDELLAEVLAMHATSAESKGFTVVHVPDPDLPPVPVDRPQMLQVFTNLVGNAVAYTPRGGHVTITVRSRDEAGRRGAAVSLHNDGPIITEEDLPHLFERFYRGQTGRDSGEAGTGLGLSISKEIVERHGGKIDVTSREGAGTTFTVWLPLEAPQAPDRSA